MYTMKAVEISGCRGRVWGVSYTALFDAMELDETLIEASDDDYQGDTFMLVRQGEQFGFLVYGWGSCSGCDAAQAVSSQVEADELARDLYNGIRWFSTAGAAVEFVLTDDDQLKWYGHSDTYGTFKATAQDWLLSQVTPEDIAEAEQSIRRAMK